MPTLQHKIADRTAHVAIIGLGYVGLPLATAFAKAGFRVTGLDVDRRKVDAIVAGQSYIPDVPDDEIAPTSNRAVSPPRPTMIHCVTWTPSLSASLPPTMPSVPPTSPTSRLLAGVLSRD